MFDRCVHQGRAGPLEVFSIPRVPHTSQGEVQEVHTTLETENNFKAEMKRKAETKTLAELMSINMGGA